VNITELLADLQTRHDEATARAGELRDQIEHFTAALTETEACLADLATARKVIVELAPAGTEPDPPESNSAYQVKLPRDLGHSMLTPRGRVLVPDAAGSPAG
jgi:hypothetical protein